MSKSIDNLLITNISKIIGEILTGSKISDMFQFLGLIDFDKSENRMYTSTKWKRINETVLYECKHSKSSKPLFKVIEYTLSPQNFIHNPETWKSIKTNVNAQLMFYGFEIDDSGKIQKSKPVESFSDAQKRLKTFSSRLEDKNIHKETIKYCRQELFNENYFHAVFEASKGLIERLRTMTNSNLDGNTLVDEIFKIKDPCIIINGNFLITETEKSECKGMRSLISTIVYLYRNPKAHNLKLYDYTNEDDAITAFTFISLAHNFLDDCIVVRFSEK